MATTYELIAKNVLGSAASSISLSSIPATYDDLLLVTSLRSTRSANADNPKLEFNGSSSNYTRRTLTGDGSSAASSTGTTITFYCPAATATSDTFSNDSIYIPNYAGSTNKSFSISSTREDNATNSVIAAIAGLWSDTSAISSIALSPNTGPNFSAGSSVYLYGITKS